MTSDHHHTDPRHARRPDRVGEPTATTMRDVSHTNPHTNESMGSLFEHGVTIVADGGKRGGVEPEETDEDSGERRSESGTEMRDVSHEAPEGGHGNRMFERVGKADDVPDEDREDESETTSDDESATDDDSAAKTPVEAADE